MNTFKGTPGEFFVEPDSLGNNTQVYAKPYKWIAGVTGQAGKIGSIPENEANAKLFAASKQMMEALQAIINHSEWQEVYDEYSHFTSTPRRSPELSAILKKAKAALSAALD